ncbi:forkhead-associated domain-containing protein 1-like [Chlamydotis macqueenii]
MLAFLKSSEACYQLKAPRTTIGRHEGCDIVLQTAGVAGRHAALEFSASINGFVLTDFNSRYGTFVNGCQIQNVSVKVNAGDILRFGAAGTSFELVVSCTPVGHRTAWNRQLRVVSKAELSKFVPHPPLSSPWGQHAPASSSSRTPGTTSRVPRPPSPKRSDLRREARYSPMPKRVLGSLVSPVSALASSGADPSRGSFEKGCASAAVGFLTGIPGSGATGAEESAFLGIQEGDIIPQEKDAGLLQVDKELDHLPSWEIRLKEKDAVIRDLRDEIGRMARMLAEVTARTKAELSQKQRTFDQELGAKTEEIGALRQQVLTASLGTVRGKDLSATDVFCREGSAWRLWIGVCGNKYVRPGKALGVQVSKLQKDVSEAHCACSKDLEIVTLRQESEKWKRDHAAVSGLVSRLLREVAEKEHKMLQLQQDVENLKEENREKDRQLAVVSAKCSRIREEVKQELGEQELTPCRNRIKELERDVERLQGEVQKYRAEQKTMRGQLAEKAKAEKTLKQQRAREALRLKAVGRKEELLRADLEQAKEQLKSFKTQVIQAWSPAAAGGAEEALTEQQVIDKVREISEENQQGQKRVKSLQEEINSRVSREEEVSANVEVFRKSLGQLQACLRSPCSSDSLREELGRLEAVCLDPSISAIGAAVVEMARVLLSWLEGAERLLASAGMDQTTSGKGLCPAGCPGLLPTLQKLVESSQETAQKNLMLQYQLERLQESQAALLQKHVKELEAKHQQDLERKMNEVVTEKDKESKEMLENAVAKEKDKCKQVLEEGQKKIQDLESQLRSLTEAMERKAKEQEVTSRELQAAVHKLEGMTVQEVALQQQLLVLEEQLETVVQEKESEKRLLQGEIAEYEEQSKQQSETILALEEKLLEAKKQQKALEEERRDWSAWGCTRAEEMLSEEGCEELSDHYWKGPLSVVGFCKWEVPSRWGEEKIDIAEARGPNMRMTKKEELAEMQNVILSKEDVISRLSNELKETRARMSDVRGKQGLVAGPRRRGLRARAGRGFAGTGPMTDDDPYDNALGKRDVAADVGSLGGELSEQLKSEVEQNMCQVKQQEEELHLLRKELLEICFVDSQQLAAFRDLPGSQRQARAECQALREASREAVLKVEEAPGIPAKVAEAFGRPAWALVNLGRRCRGQRHEETIQRQKAGMDELRGRLKMLEESQSSAGEKKGSELRVVLVKDLPGNVVRKTGLVKEPAPAPGTAPKPAKAPGAVPHGAACEAADGATGSEVFKAAERSEKTYLDTISALASLVKMRELSGTRSLKQLPQEEREQAGLQRQKHLEQLLEKLKSLQSCLEKREETMKLHESKRLKEASLQAQKPVCVGKQKAREPAAEPAKRGGA